MVQAAELDMLVVLFQNELSHLNNLFVGSVALEVLDRSRVFCAWDNFLILSVDAQALRTLPWKWLL